MMTNFGGNCYFGIVLAILLYKWVLFGYWGQLWVFPFNCFGYVFCLGWMVDGFHYLSGIHNSSTVHCFLVFFSGLGVS